MSHGLWDNYFAEQYSSHFCKMKYFVAISLMIGIACGASMYDTVKSLVTGSSTGYGGF